MNRAELEALFAAIPPLAGRDPDSFDISPLPGLTNRNFRLRAADADWVLRLPRPHSNPFIDRRAEAHNQRAAAALGLAPLWVWRDDDGRSLTPTQPGRNLAARDLIDTELLERVARLIAALHGSGVEFHGRAEAAPLIRHYAERMPAAAQRRLRDRLRAAGEWQGEVDNHDLPLVPSHNDPILDNILLGPTGPRLIDWEFSAMASPCWDLATLANAADLDRAACQRLLEAYCADAGGMKESTFYAYRELLALLSDCWLEALAVRRDG